MSVTIKDIARIAGVSPSTVSRVINGNTAISQETRSRIRAVMEELDYHPDSRARNLVNGNTDCIGLILDARDERSFFNTFFDRSVYAIERVAQEEGYTLTISNAAGEGDSSPAQKLVLEKKVDGLVIPPSVVRRDLVDMLRENGFPFVILGEPDRMEEEVSWVDADNEGGGRMAVRHLLAQGYERIALLMGSRKNVFVRNRIRGYRKGLEEAGLEPEEGLIRECGSPEDAEREAEALLNQKRPPDAFLCGDNVIAWHVLRTLRKRNVRIPKEAGIVTFDNYPFAEYLEPPLTAVDVDTYGIGEQAAYRLLQKIRKADGGERHTLISANLLIRRSSQRKGGE